jgi:peptide/nickel transport system permease protein
LPRAVSSNHTDSTTVRWRSRPPRAARAPAYFGGRLDLILQRVMDVVMAFPLIIMALAVIAIFGSGVYNVIVAITIPLIPRCARVVRSSALAIREVPYVDAARACGFGHTRTILRHMVPNVLAPFLIMLTAFVGQAILAEASQTFARGCQPKHRPTPAPPIIRIDTS